MRDLIGFSLALLLAFMIANPLVAQEEIDKKLWQKAMKIHQKAIVIDTHVDTPSKMLRGNFNIGIRSDEGHIDLIRMKEGGLDAQFMAVFVSQSMEGKGAAHYALEMIDVILQQVEANSDKAVMAYSPADIRRIHKQGKIAILMGNENGIPVENSLRLLRDFYRLGIRYITLCHMGSNFICDSSTDEPKWNGLSDFGKEVVREMNRLGIMVDVSHISDQAFWDVLKTSQAPVIASHSCARALCDAARNLSDDMIKALAEKGGVVQLAYVSDFVSQDYKDKTEERLKKLAPIITELREKYKDDREGLYQELRTLYEKYPGPPPQITSLIDQIDYIVKLVGVDYVGLGSDFDGTNSVPEGLEDVSKLPIITYHLLKRGYKEEEIIKILGGNLLRFFEKVEEVARQSS